MKILILNGPNLSRLDLREKSYYGDLDYAGLKKAIESKATSLGIDVDVKPVSYTHLTLPTNREV